MLFDAQGRLLPTEANLPIIRAQTADALMQAMLPLVAMLNTLGPDPDIDRAHKHAALAVKFAMKRIISATEPPKKH